MWQYIIGDVTETFMTADTHFFCYFPEQLLKKWIIKKTQVLLFKFHPVYKFNRFVKEILLALIYLSGSNGKCRTESGGQLNERQVPDALKQKKKHLPVLLSMPNSQEGRYISEFTIPNMKLTFHTQTL